MNNTTDVVDARLALSKVKIERLEAMYGFLTKPWLNCWNFRGWLKNLKTIIYNTKLLLRTIKTKKMKKKDYFL